MQRRLLLIATLLSLTLASTPVLAQYEERSAEDRLSETDPDFGRPLSLDEAIALGLQNNLDLEVNRYAPYTAQLDAEGAWGAYDAQFDGDVSYRGRVPTETEALSPIEVEQATTGGSAGITQLIPYVGATVGVKFDAQHNSQIRCDPADPGCLLTNSFNRLASPYDSAMTFTANVPLMRGLMWNEAWTQVKTGNLSYGGALDDFTTTVMDTVASLVTDYWALVAAKEQQRVAEKSLESTAALLDQTKTQYEVGVVSRVEVVEAEAGVANAEFNLIVARNSYRNAQDTLIAAVLGDRLRADTRMLFNPTDNPGFTDVDSIDLNKAVATAFSHRPELAAAEKRIEQGEIQLKFRRNQRLPQFDIQGSYKSGGRDGTLRDPLTGTVIHEGGMADTFDTWFDGNRDYTVKGVVSIPLQNTTARKAATKASIELRRANSQVNRLRQQIIVSIRSSARGLLASAEGVEAAERRRLAAAEQLRAEKIRLEHGESTPFDVLQRETELVDAESKKIDALKAFRDSRVTLERAQGTILETRAIQIDQVRKLF